jgi:hypothetical protein
MASLGVGVRCAEEGAWGMINVVDQLLYVISVFRATNVHMAGLQLPTPMPRGGAREVYRIQTVNTPAFHVLHTL